MSPENSKMKIYESIFLAGPYVNQLELLHKEERKNKAKWLNQKGFIPYINKKFDDIYTFTPIKFTKNNKNKYKSLSQPFYERLENDIRKRKININKLENEIFEKEKTKNNISKNYKSHSADNEKNIENYIRKKKEKINKIKDKIDTEKGITFKPHLNNEYNDKIIKEPFEIRYNICIKKRKKIKNIKKKKKKMRKIIY